MELPDEVDGGKRALAMVTCSDVSWGIFADQIKTILPYQYRLQFPVTHIPLLWGLCVLSEYDCGRFVLSVSDRFGFLVRYDFDRSCRVTDKINGYTYFMSQTDVESMWQMVKRCRPDLCRDAYLFYRRLLDGTVGRST